MNIDLTAGIIMWREFILTWNPSATFSLGASEAQLTSLEKAVGVAIPAELRQLVMESNGVHSQYDLRLIWSVEEIIKQNPNLRLSTVFRETYMPFDTLLFFADAGNGDQFALSIIQEQIKRPDVYAWDHEDDSRVWVAPSLQLYIEWWLTGKIKL